MLFSPDERKNHSLLAKNNNIFKKINNKNLLLDLLISWTQGVSYYDLLLMSNKIGVNIHSDKRIRNINIGHIIELCENAFSFDASLIISAITDNVEFLNPELIESLNTLQKMIKYVLPKKSSILLYELEFADRIISQELSENLKGNYSTRSDLKMILKRRQRESKEILIKYPDYYRAVQDNTIGS